MKKKLAEAAVKKGTQWFKNLLDKKTAGKATLEYKDNVIKSVKPSKGKAGTVKWKKEMDPEAVGYARGIREHTESESAKGYKELEKKIPHDLTYMKGQKHD